MNLKREEIVIERRPVNREAGATDIRDDEIRVPLTEEEAVVEEQKTVDADVRREEFDIDQTNVRTGTGDRGHG